MSELIIQILAASMLLATPLLLAAIGELVVEKSGVINLGVEGMMLIGGLAGFIALYQLQTSICTLELDGVCFASNTSVNQLQYLGALLVAAVVGAAAAA
ncbi:MAG: ABC transporter permease, partial [Pseudomonadota bacterium]|nr:ABC transporter permease [Pseudomonadota bacterium]